MADPVSISIALDAINNANEELRVAMDQIAGLDKAGKEASRGGLSQAKKATDAIGSSMRQLAAQVAAAFSVVAITSFVRSVVNAADELKDLAEEVGLTVEQLSKLQYAAQRGGLNDPQFQVGLRFFVDKLLEAQDVTSRAARIFRLLGVSVTDSTGKMRGIGPVLNEVATRFADSEDGANKAGFAMELFGSRNTRFVTFLNQGSKGIEALGNELQRIGGVVTTEAANKAADFNDQVDTLSAAARGLALDLAEAVLPSITDVIRSMTDGTTQSELWEDALNNVSAVARFLANSLDVVVTAISEVIDSFATFVRILQPHSLISPLLWLHNPMQIVAAR